MRIERGEGWEMREEWRPIPGHAMYEASSLGRIRSWAVRGWPGRRSSTPRVLAIHYDAAGYARISLGRGVTESVHALVAGAFHGERRGCDVCRHLDGNPRNNTPSNLRWGSHHENQMDKYGHGTMQLGERHHAAKLSDAAVSAIRSSLETVSALARRYGVSRKAISLARDGRTWRHVA